MLLKCIETIKDQFQEEVLFTKDKLYEYTHRENRWTKARGYIGFTIDDKGEKRWLTEKFLVENFQSV